MSPAIPGEPFALGAYAGSPRATDGCHATESPREQVARLGYGCGLWLREEPMDEVLFADGFDRP